MPLAIAGFSAGRYCWASWALLVSFFSDCFMEEAYEGDLDVIFNYGSGQRPQGLSWVGIVCISKNIFEPHLSPYMPPCLVASLGGSKTGMESSSAKNLPS